MLDLENVEVSLTLLKCDSTTDALPAILKFSEQTKETLVVESAFGIYTGGWIGHLEFFKRNAIKDIYFL